MSHTSPNSKVPLYYTYVRTRRHKESLLLTRRIGARARRGSDGKGCEELGNARLVCCIFPRELKVTVPDANGVAPAVIASPKVPGAALHPLRLSFRSFCGGKAATLLKTNNNSINDISD